MLRRTCLFLIPLLLVLPFDPEWIDFERARRGLLMLLAGAALLTPGLAKRKQPAWELWAFVGLALVSVLSISWAGDRLSALEYAAYFLALAAICFLDVDDPERRRALSAGFVVAVLATSGFGLAQWLGLDWPAGYSPFHEPVSTLGNTNVAAEWSVVALPFCLLVPRPLAAVTLFVTAGTLWVNGGRAGLLGLYAALVVVLVRPGPSPKQTRLVWAAALLLAPLITFAKPTGPAPERPQGAARAAAPSTVEVRKKLYPAVADMALDNLPFGVGIGNFRRDFPKYRDHDEIKLSSLDGKLLTRVTVAHDDPLQVFAELGIPGLLAMLAFVFLLIQGARYDKIGPVGLAALAAFVPITLFRSPLWNAPAAAALLLALRASLHADSRPWTVPKAVLPVVAIVILVPGAIVVHAEAVGARFLRAQSAKNLSAVLARLDTGVTWDPFETRWHVLRAQILRKNARLATRELGLTPDTLRTQRLHDAAAVLEREPANLDALVEAGWLGFEVSGLRERGRKAIAQGRALDPYDPRLMDLALLYEALRRGFAGLEDPKKAAEGRQALKQITKKFFDNKDAQTLLFEYAVRDGNRKAAVDALRAVGDLRLIDDKIAELGKRARGQTDEATQMTLLRIQLDLRALRRELQ